MPLNKTKTDILLVLSEIFYYCPLHVANIMQRIVYRSGSEPMKNKEVLKELKLLRDEWKKYPSKKGQTR